jgi:hypothetical protein
MSSTHKIVIVNGSFGLFSKEKKKLKKKETFGFQNKNKQGVCTLQPK